MLALLVTITLRINDELMDKTGRGAIEDFVDWPLYDESVFEAAKLTGCEKKAVLRGFWWVARTRSACR